MTVYLSLGSNMGDRDANLRQAIAELPGVTKVSPIYETEPADFIHQPWFLNCVVELETDLPPAELLRTTQAVEQKLGRSRIIPRGPRTLDIDILTYGEQRVKTPTLTIPHPRMTTRRFVLAPLMEIAPEFVHPVTGRTAVEMLGDVTDPLSVRKL